MADAQILVAAKKFAALVTAECPSVKEALHFEPEELGSIPAVTLLQKRLDQEDLETGPQTTNTWTFVVSITLGVGGRIGGSSFQQAQEDLLATLPEVLAVVRHHPDLDGTCERATITDLGEEPDVEVDEQGSPTGVMVKTLEMTLITEEV